jgi:hypothetical protein
MSDKCRGDEPALSVRNPYMVLYPITGSRSMPDNGVVSAWEAIERKQRETAEDWWLVAQPDHAVIAGSLARQIDSPLFPTLDEDIVEAIALHDDGWTDFDSLPRGNNSSPLSFLDAPIADFLQAWRGSIARAEQSSAIGGIIVSEHFCRIAQLRPADNHLLSDFLGEEAERQLRLKNEQTRSDGEIRLLVDVLQFCDLLSLYACCGSRQNIEFPQKFQGVSIRLRREGELCRMEPGIFGGGMSLAVAARKFSDFGRGQSLPVMFS